MISPPNEIEPWMNYYVRLVLVAQNQAMELIDFTLNKTRFFDNFRSALNERQFKAINRMFEAGPEGFQGGMTAFKYTSITKAPKATATRDLQALVQMGAPLVEGDGRSTHYRLNLGLIEGY